MKNNYTFIGYGELGIDEIYDSNFNLLKKDGGDTTWNILYNLGLMKEKVYAIGVVGNDINAKVAIDSLNRANVNTDFIEKRDKATNIIYSVIKKDEKNRYSTSFSKKSPITNKSSINMCKELPLSLPKKLSNEAAIVILMDFYKRNLNFVKSIERKKVALDMGHKDFFEKYSKTYIYNFLRKVNICQINGNLLEALCKKLEVKDEIELYKKLNLDLMVITFGDKGAKFVYGNNEKVCQLSKKPIKKIKNPIDTSGAGDIFFSIILKHYKNYMDKEIAIGKDFVDIAFAEANMESCKIIQQIGCRI